MDPNEFPFHPIVKKPRRRWGWFVCIAGWILFLVSIVFCFVFGDLLLFIILLFIGTLIIVRWSEIGRRMRSLDAITILANDTRDPVLYLRPFSDDDLIDLTQRIPNPLRENWVRIEESIKKALKDLGPLIAFGKPGEQWPETGAARIYVSNEEWQTAVRYFINHSIAVIVTIGLSVSVRWEIEETIKTKEIDKLLFFFPFSILRRQTDYYSKLLSTIWISKSTRMKIQEDREERYAVFKKEMENVLQYNLPEALGEAVFIDFDRQGQPRLLKTMRPSLFLDIIQISLKNRFVGIDFRKTLQPFLSKFQDN
jgi:hypothetical protein